MTDEVKWTKVKGKKTDEKPVDPEAAANIFALAGKFRELSEQKKELKDQGKEVQSKLDEVNEALVASMVNAEVPNFSFKDKTFYMISKLYASYDKGFTGEVHLALRQHDQGSLIQESINPKTLNSYIVGVLEENDDELPSWLTKFIKTYEETKIGMRKK